MILQIQDNDDDLEERLDFVDIDDMLFDELDLSWLLRRLLPLSLRQLLRWPLNGIR